MAGLRTSHTAPMDKLFEFPGDKLEAMDVDYSTCGISSNFSSARCKPISKIRLKAKALQTNAIGAILIVPAGEAAGDGEHS
jgi:hypothetical protein